jgi:hypothetical protein
MCRIPSMPFYMRRIDSQYRRASHSFLLVSMLCNSIHVFGLCIRDVILSTAIGAVVYWYHSRQISKCRVCRRLFPPLPFSLNYLATDHNACTSPSCGARPARTWIMRPVLMPMAMGAYTYVTMLT